MSPRKPMEEFYRQCYYGNDAIFEAGTLRQEQNKLLKKVKQIKIIHPVIDLPFIILGKWH